MKFKAIFFIFNGIILFSFLLIFLMPLFVLGFDYAKIFWSESWYLLLIFLGILSVLDGYFMFNWSLFTSLEKEDWRGLQNFLSKRLFEKNQFSNQNINLYVNASLMLNEPERIDTLAEHVAKLSPKKAQRHAINLGIPVLLRHNPQEIIDRFGTLWPNSQAPHSMDPWIGWNFGFGLLLSGETEKAKTVLHQVLSQKGRDYALGLVTIFMLKEFEDQTSKNQISQFIEEIQKKYSLASWTASIQKQQDTIQIFILHSILQEAAQWVFSQDPSHYRSTP